MKKILLVAYAFPPLEDAQSLRWYYLSQELAKLGYYIDVVTIKHPAPLDYKIHNNITIHRVYPGFFESVAYKIKNKIGVGDSDNEKKRISLKFKAAKSIYFLFRSFFGAIFPGNITTEWYPFVKKYFNNYINVQNYDFLITSHEPWVDSLLGLYIKKKNPRIKWVGDFGDPYVSIYTPKFKLFFENKIENKIYKNTDLLIFTNKTVYNSLTNKYSYLEKKKHLILEQGFNIKLKQQNSKNKIFTMVYTGTFYKDFRNPFEIAKALSMLDFKFRFIVAGRNEQFNYLFKPLGKKYKFLGFRSHKYILKLQNRADLLIHLSNKQIEQVPGKFYEYLGSGTPILMIYQNDKDQLIKLTKKLGCGLVCKNSYKEIYKKITLLYENKIKFHRDDKAIEYFSWENRAKLLDKALNSIE